MNAPLISIIIPVYNDEPYIAETLESCINQTFRDIEIVVVDDASTDKTPDIIEKYALSDNRIKVIRHTENKKTFIAKNSGIMSASGQYIVVISGDDTFELNAMEVFSKTIKENPTVDIVHYGRRVLSKNGHELRNLVPNPAKIEGDEILKELFSPLGESKVNHQVRKRSLYVEVYNRYFKNSKRLVLGEDQLMAFLYILRAEKYIGITDKLYNYYFYRGNDGKQEITLDYFLNYRMNIIDSMNELQRCLDETGVDGWVWERFIALKRHHYAWAVFVAEKMNKKDATRALSAWVERADATDTLIGIMTTTPQILRRYTEFINSYKKPNQSIETCQKVIKVFEESYAKDESDLRDKNKILSAELRSHMSIKRSAKLTLGNMKRRIVNGKKR